MRYEADIIDTRGQIRGRTYKWHQDQYNVKYEPDYKTQPRKVRGTVYRVRVRWQIYSAPWACGPGLIHRFTSAEIRCPTNPRLECKF